MVDNRSERQRARLPGEVINPAVSCSLITFDWLDLLCEILAFASVFFFWTELYPTSAKRDEDLAEQGDITEWGSRQNGRLCDRGV